MSQDKAEVTKQPEQDQAKAAADASKTDQQTEEKSQSVTTSPNPESTQQADGTSSTAAQDGSKTQDKDAVTTNTKNTNSNNNNNNDTQSNTQQQQEQESKQQEQSFPRYYYYPSVSTGVFGSFTIPLKPMKRIPGYLETSSKWQPTPSHQKPQPVIESTIKTDDKDKGKDKDTDVNKDSKETNDKENNNDANNINDDKPNANNDKEKPQTDENNNENNKTTKNNNNSNENEDSAKNNKNSKNDNNSNENENTNNNSKENNSGKDNSNDQKPIAKPPSRPPLSRGVYVLAEWNFAVNSKNGTLFPKFYVCKGSVVECSCEAIVNAANEGCLGGGGVDGAFCSAGGRKLDELRHKLPLVSGYARCKTGSAVITGSGYGTKYNRLLSKYVIHAVGPSYGYNNFKKQDQQLYGAYRDSMLLGKKHGIKTIGFCLLSAGIFSGGRDLDAIIRIGIQAVHDHVYDGCEEIYMIGFKSSEIAILMQMAPKVFGQPVVSYVRSSGNGNGRSSNNRNGNNRGGNRGSGNRNNRNGNGNGNRGSGGGGGGIASWFGFGNKK